MFTCTYRAFLLLRLLCYVQGSVPQWPTAYSVRGTIEVPYAEIEEPFEAWYDNDVASSRIDYYNGTVKTYQLSNVGKYGTYIKLQPVISKMKCFKSEGNRYWKVEPNNILPNMTDYKNDGVKLVNGVVAEKWVNTEEDSVHTMYLIWQEDTNNPGVKSIIPIRYDVKASDHHYMNFYGFTAAKPSPDVFSLNDTDCEMMEGSEGDRVYEFDPMRDYSGRETRHLEQAWQSYKTKYNKQYSDQDQELLRKKLFRQRMRYITSVNRANLSYTLGLNHLADYTPEEMRVLSSCVLPRGGFGRSGSFHLPYDPEDEIDDEPLPRLWDWRNRGAVTPVKDQSDCGSCWSFSVSGTIEGSHYIKTGKLLRLSEQSLVDCSWDVGNMACEGGIPVRTFFWVMKNGIPIDKDYGPYLAQDNFCHINSTKKRVSIKGIRPVKPMCVDCFKRALIKNGPVAVTISTQPESFMFYKNGVYDDPKCVKNYVGHAVLVVGYGVLNGQEYWIMKNSWSIYWGMSGYMLMAIEGNTCHVMEDLLVVKN